MKWSMLPLRRKIFTSTLIIFIFLIFSSPPIVQSDANITILEPNSTVISGTVEIKLKVTNPLIDKIYIGLMNPRHEIPPSGGNPVPCYWISPSTGIDVPTSTATERYVQQTWKSYKNLDGSYYLNVWGKASGSSTWLGGDSRNVNISNQNPETSFCTAPPLSANIFANETAGAITINNGSSAVIRWESKNADSCNVTSGSILWSGTNDSKNTGNLTSSKTYTVNCFGEPAVPVNASVTVNIVNNSSANQAPSNSSGNSSNSTNTNNSSTANTQANTETTSPEIITSQTLASTEKLEIEEEIPVSISEFDPDVFLKGNNIKFTAVRNIRKAKTNFIRFEGKTKPNTLVTLYIFSNPIIVTLKSDEQGSWFYEREKKIETGKHSAFATIYDDGVTRRSDITRFFVAKNSSGNLILKQSSFDNLYLYAIIIGIVIVLSIIILIMYRIYISKRVKGS